MERDKLFHVVKTNLRDFNSHAHVERDIQTKTENLDLKISTHTLTWSVTMYQICNINFFVISTHTLTWSVTMGLGKISDIKQDFNSHAHVERDIFQSYIKRE